MAQTTDLEDESSTDFIAQTYLSYIIPARTGFSLDEELRQTDPPRSLFAGIGQRECLYFDETVDILLVLKTPRASENVLRSRVEQLLISLEAHVVNTQLPGRQSPPAADVIFSASLDSSTRAHLVLDEAEDSDDEDSGHFSYAAWKVPVFVNRPRIRLHGPSVVFKASASFLPSSKNPTGSQASGYLQSGVAASANILEAFGADPDMHGVTPRLSALRVSRVMPMTQPKDRATPIKSLQQLKIKVFPAVQTRMRFSRALTGLIHTDVIAVVEVDFTQHCDCEILLDQIDLSVPACSIENLNEVPGLKLPLPCVAHDSVTFLYRIAPDDVDGSARSPVRDIEITVRASIQIEPGVCQPKLEMNWVAPVDFTVPVNPGFGPAMQPIQRSHRPSQLSIGNSKDGTSLISPSVTRPDSLPTLEAAAAAARTAEAAIPDLGITMTFCASSEPIYPGEEFSWTVHVVNRTAEKASGAAARKLALVPLPWRKRADMRGPRPLTSMSKPTQGGGGVVEAVIDQSVAYNMQRNAVLDTSDVVSLSADARVGPLGPGSCQSVELRFLALKAGILGLEAVRVIDLGSQEHVDVRDLPLMIVEER